MTALDERPLIEVDTYGEEVDEMVEAVPDHVIVCLGGLGVHTNGSPIFGCKVYGPFTAEEIIGVEREIRKLEGGAVLIRPLVDLNDTYRRISAD